MSTLRGLQIAPACGQQALTPEQKRFNTLIRQIEQARQKLAAWRDNIPLYLQAHTKVVVPLLAALAAKRREFAFALDGLLNQPGWTKNERATLRELVCETAGEILEGQGAEIEDAAVKALFDKHADLDFDTERQESRMLLKGMFEEMNGVHLGADAEIASEEALFKRMHEELAARAARQAEATAAAPPRVRRKSKAQQSREAEAQQATQSLREIFRKLASALHPDRETDPEQRSAKTALMQRVNQAYAANDLLTLLELQLQIEQVDAGHIATASAQRLRHYNKVLAEQLRELQAESAREEMRFHMDYGAGSGWGMNPAKLGATIGPTARALRSELAVFERDLRTFADRAATKQWLKRERQRQREAAFDDDMPF